MTSHENQTTQVTAPCIYDYLNYRAYLHDWYKVAKERYGFSYRVFVRRSGLRSPSFFKFVADGTRNLTDESLRKFVKGLRLTKPEREYFRLLVHFNQAKDYKQKSQYYNKIVSFKEYKRLKPVAKAQHEYYATWYHPVLRELITSPDFKGDIDWLAKRVCPHLTPQQVKHSIDLLERLGFIRKVDGSDPVLWQQSTPLVTSGSEVSAFDIMNYHQHVLRMVQEQLPIVDWEKRDVSALTLGVVRNRLPELKKKIQDFRSEVLKFVSSDQDPEEVVMLSMQLMPVTAFED